MIFRCEMAFSDFLSLGVFPTQVAFNTCLQRDDAEWVGRGHLELAAVHRLQKTQRLLVHFQLYCTQHLPGIGRGDTDCIKIDPSNITSCFLATSVK